MQYSPLNPTLTEHTAPCTAKKDERRQSAALSLSGHILPGLLFHEVDDWTVLYGYSPTITFYLDTGSLMSTIWGSTFATQFFKHLWKSFNEISFSVFTTKRGNDCFFSKPVFPHSTMCYFTYQVTTYSKANRRVLTEVFFDKGKICSE